ncbi:MAG: hypothetical protein DWQ45_02115 [Planctomycetota bacterium]|nr:MAG: hypothetical protein DWQ45_02115 [Planctomycetota bacterium]
MGWKAGSSTVNITPEGPMWMAGYAARNKPSESVLQELFAKVLVIEDAGGTSVAIVTCDLIGIPRTLRESLEAKVLSEFGLPRDALLLNASHTHCGPELRVSKVSAYELGEDRVRQAEEYTRGLEDKLTGAIGEAIERLEPATLEYCYARCGFAMNRRLPVDGSYRNSPNPDGPVDHTVPVLVVRNGDNDITTLLFGYACHNTTLGIYQFNGDYAGFAQEYLEEALPGARAMFLMGCGGDQNPYPRSEIPFVRQHGRALCNSVLAALQTPPKPIAGPLRCAIDSVTLEFAAPDSREELERQAQSDNKYESRHAQLLLEELETTGTIRTDYDYLAQAVRFGDDLLLVALAGEVVVDYSLKLKQELDAPIVWVAGYSNDVFGYVPSLRVLKEGGYEAGGAFRYSSFPGPFAETVEERVLKAVSEVVKRTSEP